VASLQGCSFLEQVDLYMTLLKVKDLVSREATIRVKDLVKKVIDLPLALR